MNKSRKLCLVALSAVCFATVARAETVNMQLTGVGNGYVMAGVYTSPYTGTINGGQPPISIICDDFVDDTFFNESWMATHTTVAALGPTRFDTGGGSMQKQDYDAAAALAIQLLSQTDQTIIGYYSYAIWDIFSDASVKNWLMNHGTQTMYDQAHTLATNALSGNYSSGQFGGVSFANVDIYTPIAGTATGCPGGTCPSNSPQEFLVVRAPEASSLAVLGVDLLMLLGVVVLFRRRTAQAAK
jgi:hypothetical protein